MFRTKKTMQQMWDDQITSYRDRADDELRTASRWDTVTSSRVGKWLHWLPITDLATSHRATAVDYRDTATRMDNCPHNPRNGGTGWRDPEPSQLNALDKAFILLRLGCLIVLAGAVMFGVVLIAYQHDPHLTDSLPRYLLVNVEALAAAAWALTVTTWAMTGVLTAWGWVRGHVRGADE